MQRRTFVWAAAAAALGPAIHAQAAEGARAPRPPMPKTLTFGLISPRDPQEMLRNWGPFLDRMGQSMRLEVLRPVYASAAELVKDFQAGKLDAAWLGNAAALDIVESGAGSVFAAMVNQGKWAYRSVLITQQDSALRSVDDVIRRGAQLRFGDGDEKSVSGHIVPMYFAFLKRGVSEPDKLFKEVRRGSHEANLFAVARGEVDVATNNTSELAFLRTRSPEEAARIRVIWESPDIPESPMVWRTDLPAPVKQRLARFVFGFGAQSPEEKEILWKINKLTGWRQSSNRQLVNIADIEMFNARQRIMSDPKLTEAQRLERVEEITRRGSKLELMLKSTS